MKLGSIAIKNIFSKPLSSLLSILLFGFGVSIIVLILLVSSHLKKEINNNAAGIDLVVGAKGSPLQLILANIFHVDFPTGNISLKESGQLTRNRLIKKTIPVSLGDSFAGYRIVGTNQSFLELYKAEFASGKWNSNEMQAFLGHEVQELLQLNVGDKFSSTHGMSDVGAAHEEHPFEVAGVFKPTGSVLDRLIIVSVQSVWHVHNHEADHAAHADSLHTDIEIPWMNLTVTKEQYENEDITALLIQYASPMGAIRLPRLINDDSNFQAASPAFESARLFSLIGTGVEIVSVLGIVIILISAISVLIALVNSLKERKYELAIMRSMGASRGQLFVLVMMEGAILTVFGILLGFGLAHAGMLLIGNFAESLNISGITFIEEELQVLLGAMAVGVLSALIPSIMAYRSNISETLAKG